MPKVAVDERLAPMLFVSGRGAAQFVTGDVTGFEFFDEPRAGFELDTTVNATSDVRRPIVDRNFRLNKNFAAITGSAWRRVARGRDCEVPRRDRADANLRPARNRSGQNYPLRPIRGRRLRNFIDRIEFQTRPSTLLRPAPESFLQIKIVLCRDVCLLQLHFALSNNRACRRAIR